jgi:hypothetical protein
MKFSTLQYYHQDDDRKGQADQDALRHPRKRFESRGGSKASDWADETLKSSFCYKRSQRGVISPIGQFRRTPSPNVKCRPPGFLERSID